MVQLSRKKFRNTRRKPHIGGSDNLDISHIAYDEDDDDHDLNVSGFDESIIDYDNLREDTTMKTHKYYKRRSLIWW